MTEGQVLAMKVRDTNEWLFKAWRDDLIHELLQRVPAGMYVVYGMDVASLRRDKGVINMINRVDNWPHYKGGPHESAIRTFVSAVAWSLKAELSENPDWYQEDVRNQTGVA
jgi:hypothetical protein